MEELIRSIVFLGGAPVVSKLNPIRIGQAAELADVGAYNDDISFSRHVADQAAVDLLPKILKSEEGRVYWAEKRRT